MVNHAPITSVKNYLINKSKIKNTSWFTTVGIFIVLYHL